MDFIQEIVNSKGEVYLVGGCVRNILYNKIHNTNIPIKDRDLLVRNVSQNNLIKILEKHGNVKQTGILFGVIKFSNKNLVKYHEIDIALPRKEISKDLGENKYHNFVITSDPNISLLEDFSRRDATINAIAIQIYNINDFLCDDININNIIDPFNGFEDITNKLWRTVGLAQTRFKEDPTRIMRALRQSSELGLKLEQDTELSIIKHKDLMNYIHKTSPTRLTEELVRLISGQNHLNILRFIFDNKLYVNLELHVDSFKYFEYANKHKISISPKLGIALLLNSHVNRNAIKWTKIHELSACSHFDRQDTLFIKCVNELYSYTYIFYNKKTEYEIKKLMQNIENKFVNNTHRYILDLIWYYGIVNSIDINIINDLIQIYERNKHTELSINHVKLDGNTIKKYFNLEPKDYCKIKEIKKICLDAITEHNIENTSDMLLAYVKQNYK